MFNTRDKRGGGLISHYIRGPIMTQIRTFINAAVIAALSVSTAFAQHVGDVVVGRTAAGRLTIGGFSPDDNIVVLPPVSGLFNGWSDNNPGFDRLVTSEPENDFYTLGSGVQVRIEVVSVDPAFMAVSSSFVVIDDPGERIILGGSTLHAHLTWLINSNEPDFDPLKVLWQATFRLVDTGSTAYTASEPFTFYFANTACDRGDCNGDLVKDALDVQAFVDIVLNPGSHSVTERCSADLNQDGYATLDDVAGFVEMLLDV